MTGPRVVFLSSLGVNNELFAFLGHLGFERKTATMLVDSTIILSFLIMWLIVSLV